jgi:hypothetical protein
VEQVIAANAEKPLVFSMLPTEPARSANDHSGDAGNVRLAATRISFIRHAHTASKC